MLGMNAEMIRNAVAGLVQLLVQSTRQLNELTGCETDQSTDPSRRLKVRCTRARTHKSVHNPVNRFGRKWAGVCRSY